MNNLEKLKDLRKRLAAISIAGVMTVAGTGVSTTKAYAEEKSPKISSTINMEDSKEFVSQNYITKEEAEKWLNEKEKILLDNNYDITNKQIIELSNQLLSSDVNNINETFDTLDEAEQRKKELESKGIDANLTITKQEVGVNSFDETFDTLDEAEQFNKEHGNNLLMKEIYSDWIFKESKVVGNFSSTSFEEVTEEANKLKDELENNNNDLSKYVVEVSNSQVTEKNQINEIHTNIEKVFNTKEEAEKFVQNLINNGYIINNIDYKIINQIITEKVPTGEIIINNSSKHDSNDSFEIEGNYLMIKQAKGNVVIWTKEELSNKQQESFKQNWLNGNYDASVSDNYNFYFISGEGVKDLSFIGNGWGAYNISYNDGTITMTCDAKKVSHVNGGSFEYKYTETKKEVECVCLTAEQIEKVFEEVTNYTAIVNSEEYYRTKKYNVSGTYENGKESYKLSGEYTLEKFGTLYYAVIDAKEKKHDKIIITTENPETSDNSNLDLAVAMAAGSFLGTGLILTRSRKKSEE